MSEAVCPADGQTAEWHNKVYGTRPRLPGDTRKGTVSVTFGDRIGCYFGADLGREVVRTQQAREVPR